MLLKKVVTLNNDEILNMPVSAPVLTPVVYPGKVIVPVHLTMTFIWFDDVGGIDDDSHPLNVDWQGSGDINFHTATQSFLKPGVASFWAGNINATGNDRNGVPLIEAAGLPIILHTQNGAAFTGGDSRNRLILQLLYFLAPTVVS
jgi:hypothetical protein